MNIGKDAAFEQDRNYEDMDGNLKTFTIRDYSGNKKTIGTNKFDIDYSSYFKQYREELIERILSSDASFGVPEHEKYVLQAQYEYEWDVNMIKDEGMSIDELVRIVTIVENKKELGDLK